VEELEPSERLVLKAEKEPEVPLELKVSRAPEENKGNKGRWVETERRVRLGLLASEGTEESEVTWVGQESREDEERLVSRGIKARGVYQAVTGIQERMVLSVSLV